MNGALLKYKAALIKRALKAYIEDSSFNITVEQSFPTYSVTQWEIASINGSLLLLRLILTISWCVEAERMTKAHGVIVFDGHGRRCLKDLQITAIYRNLHHLDFFKKHILPSVFKGGKIALHCGFSLHLFTNSTCI